MDWFLSFKANGRMTVRPRAQSQLNCLLAILLVGVSGGAFASNSGSVPVGQKPTPNPAPYERRISLPTLHLLTTREQERVKFEPGQFRLSLVCLLGTWNKQSEQIHHYFEKNNKFFKERKIAAVGAFSHDTIENLKTWAEKRNPSYLFGLAQMEFVDALKNPKLPSCWLLSKDGQLLRKMEHPSENDLRSVYDKLNQWTDF